MGNVWIQLFATIGAVLAGMFVTIRYAIKESNKKEKTFLDYLENMNARQLEYYTQKNGHLERISETFAKTIDKNTRALDKLSARIKDTK